MTVWRLVAEGVTSREAFARQFRANRICLEELSRRSGASSIADPRRAEPISEKCWSERGPFTLRSSENSSLLSGVTGFLTGLPFFASSAQTLLRLEASLVCAFNALRHPTDDFHIATLSEFTGQRQLKSMWKAMREDSDGRRVLSDKPLLDGRFVNFAALSRLPSDTLGFALSRFWEENKLHAGQRQPVRFVQDEELAYVLTRYRQLHDVMHAAFGMGISVESEVALKLIEFIQTNLPMTFLAAAVGPLAVPLIRGYVPEAAFNPHFVGSESAAVAEECQSRLSVPNGWLQLKRGSLPVQPDEARRENVDPMLCAEETKALFPRHTLMTELLPWAASAGRQMKLQVFCVYIEEWLDKPLVRLLPCSIPPSSQREILVKLVALPASACFLQKEFREHCGIKPPPPHLLPYCM